MLGGGPGYDTESVSVHYNPRVSHFCRCSMCVLTLPRYTYKKGRAILQERQLRLEASTHNWENQMGALVSQYLEWKSSEPGEDEDMAAGGYVFEVTAITTFSEFSLPFVSIFTQ